MRAGEGECLAHRLRPPAVVGPWLLLGLFLFLFFGGGGLTVAYSGSQAMGRIGPLCAGLCHSHSNARSKVHLRPTPQPQQHQILNSLSRARDGTCSLMDTSQIRFR